MPHHWRPLAHKRNSVFKCKEIQPMILVDLKNITWQWCSAWAKLLVSNVNKYNSWSEINITTQWCSTGRHFTAATKALNISSCKLVQLRNRKAPRKHTVHVENSILWNRLFLDFNPTSQEWSHGGPLSK